MSEQQNQFERALAGFDTANARDPNRIVVDGIAKPRELAYSHRMTDWLARLDPSAGDGLRLAARAQHICRWMCPRADYPMNRAGYHRWRTNLGRFHAETAAAIMLDAGYDAATIERVGSMLRKEHLKSDPETQTLEDVICLVFLENYFADFALQHPREKVIGIVRKTWNKMSKRGQAEAMKLPLPSEAAGLIQEALAGNPIDTSIIPE